MKSMIISKYTHISIYPNAQPNKVIMSDILETTRDYTAT